MKKITRMIFFSGFALFVTDFWNKGFSINYNWEKLFLLVVGVAFLNYLINPILKLILLPLNIITLGMSSLLIYFILFYFLVNYFPVVKIVDWNFNGYYINYYLNLALSAASVSIIINFLEIFL